jgi:hypothetical protein
MPAEKQSKEIDGLRQMLPMQTIRAGVERMCLQGAYMGQDAPKQKATAVGGFAAKCLSRLDFVWLLDLGSNQGPTD